MKPWEAEHYGDLMTGHTLHILFADWRQSYASNSNGWLAIIFGSLMLSVGIIKSGKTFHPDRAPFKEVWGGQYTYREGEGKCCGRALIKASGWVENDSVIKIRAPKRWVVGVRIQAHSTVGRGIHRALINRWGRIEGQIEDEWVVVALSNRPVQQVYMQVTIPTSSGTYP